MSSEENLIEHLPENHKPRGNIQFSLQKLMKKGLNRLLNFSGLLQKQKQFTHITIWKQPA
jgi:hypothetical protein